MLEINDDFDFEDEHYEDDDWDYWWFDESCGWEKHVATPKQLLGELYEFYNSDKPRYYTYTIHMKRQRGWDIHFRTDIPCYGELRKYRLTHGDTATQPEHKPTDLHCSFPTEGTPCGVSACWRGDSGGDAYRFIKYCFEESPYRHAFGKTSVHRTKADLVFVWFEDGKFNPTPAVHLFKTLSQLVGQPPYTGTGYKKWYKFVEAGYTKDEALFLTMFLTPKDNPSQQVKNWLPGDSYVYTPYPSFECFMNGDYNKTLSPKTFAQGEDYNRQNLHDVWRNPNKTPPVTLYKAFTTRFKSDDTVSREDMLNFLIYYDNSAKENQ